MKFEEKFEKWMHSNYYLHEQLQGPKELKPIIIEMRECLADLKRLRDQNFYPDERPTVDQWNACFVDCEQTLAKVDAFFGGEGE